MSEKINITFNYLNQFLSCDAGNGKLFWISRDREFFGLDRIFKSWNTRFAGREVARRKDTKGYWQVVIAGRPLQAHRVVWMMVNQQDIPHGLQIDHINGLKDDNSPSNLRLATVSQNNRNAEVRSDSVSGFKGVSRDLNKWRARIQIDGKTKCLGRYDTIEEASEAYTREADREYGEFALHKRPVTTENMK